MTPETPKHDNASARRASKDYAYLLAQTQFRNGATRKAVRAMLEADRGIASEYIEEALNKYWKPKTQKAVGPEVEPHENEEPQQGPYCQTPHGLTWKRPGRDGEVEIPLTNFTATITGDIEERDGVEVTRRLEIEARLRGRSSRFTISADQFARMSWPIENLGANAIVSPGFGLRDQARTAIQFLSGEIPSRTVYTHLGWRQFGDTWGYLHGGGAIGPEGPMPGVDVRLSDSLSRYVLPPPATDSALKDAVLASLKFLALAPERITVPLYAAIWRSVIGLGDFSVHLVGSTGGGKTELAALLQQHFGAGMDASHLPGSWKSTGNFLDDLAFLAKDALLLVDDFAPTGSQADVQRYHSKAEGLLRGQGNNAGRGRMRANGTLKLPRPPRGTILSTGEDAPRGQSLLARVLVVEISRNDLRWDSLTNCQRDAADGIYAQALAGFLRWLAPRYGTLQGEFRERVQKDRETLHRVGEHRRLASDAAGLVVALGYFLTFAREVGALSVIEEQALQDRAAHAIKQVANAQPAYQTASDPVPRFLEQLASLLASGRAHVAGPDGGPPEVPAAWGWRKDAVSEALRPQGQRIGWVEGADLYLDPEAAYAEVQRLGSSSGDTLAVASKTLHKRLNEQKLLLTTDKSRGTLTIRRMLDGARREVLHFAARSVMSTESDQPDQSAHQCLTSGDGRDGNGQDGQIGQVSTTKPHESGEAA